MSGVTMREGAVAFAKFSANSWGVAASVTKGAYFESDGGMKQSIEYIADQSFGQRFLGQAETGNFPAQNLSLTQPAKFADHSYILEACAMGSPAAVTISTSTSGQTTSWLHIIDLAPTTDGLGITLAYDKVLYVDELTSAKVTGFGLSADGALMKETFKVTGSKPTNISSVNTRSTVNGANFPGISNRIFTKHGVFRTNLQSGGSLVAADAVQVEQCALSWDAPNDAPHAYGQDYIIEPANHGFPDLTLTVTFPRANTVSANSFYAAQRDGTVLKGDLTFSGNFINSTDRYSLVFQFPQLEPQDTSNLSNGAQQMKPTAMFKASMASSSPNGMPFVNPMRVRRITTQSVVAF